jgi:hypothetical protein
LRFTYFFADGRRQNDFLLAVVAAEALKKIQHRGIPLLGTLRRPFRSPIVRFHPHRHSETNAQGLISPGEIVPRGLDVSDGFGLQQIP